MDYKTYQMNLIEIWKPISYASNYHISTFGKFKKDGVVKPKSKGCDYTSVSVNGIVRPFHVLVMETFVGVPKNGKKLVVNHRDRNKKNNRLDNLEYITHRGNMLHVLIEKSDTSSYYPYGRQQLINLIKEYNQEKKKALKCIINVRND